MQSLRLHFSISTLHSESPPTLTLLSRPLQHRGLSGFMNFAFGFTEVSVLASVTALFHYGLQTGGPVVWFWGWVVSWAAITVVSFSMAEICSAYPSAGSVYHWSGQLAPARHAAIASYITGAGHGAGVGCVPGCLCNSLHAVPKITVTTVVVWHRLV